MPVKRDFKTLSEREHILTRPAMYIGSIVEVEKEQWVYDREGKCFRFGATRFVPALLKICDEIVDNSLDVAIDNDFNHISSIKVSVSDDTITVEDDGPGIPVAPPSGGDKEGRNCPEIAWTQMRSGTSFKENRKGPSANGVGSTCCNVFCKFFEGTSDDGKKRQTVTCSDNMSVVKVSKVAKSKGKTGVKVVMKPDLERFGLSVIDESHKALIYQRLLNLAICYPHLTFSFNGKRIAVSGSRFASMFSQDAIVSSCRNATVVVFPNSDDEFRFYSYVNGLNCVRGGSQVDFVAGEICSRVRDKMVKKYKSIRPGDIKSKLGLVVFLTDFENAQFDAQTKESLANSNGDISKHLKGGIDFDELAKRVLKTPSIIDPIVDTFKIKEELKAKHELKSSKKVKVKSDKYMAAIGKRTYCVLAEGLSAMSGISSCLGRNGFGYYAMRGLPINAYSQSMQKISANQEFKDIMNILGLDITKDAKNTDIEYEKVLIATDADCYEGDTLVLMEEGVKPIGEVVVGDRVLDADGVAREVVDVVSKRTNEVVVIRTVNGGCLTVSRGQKVIVDRNWETLEVPAEEVLDTDCLFQRGGVLCHLESAGVVECLDEVELFDITLEDNHRFFVKLAGSGEVVLAHNCDGSHITAMLVGWFKRFAPKLFEEGKVCKLVTPLIMVKDGKGRITEYFFTLAEFKEWERKHKVSGNILYLKGLGSWEKSDLQYLIDKEGVERFIKPIELDGSGDRVIEEWLGDDTEPRKKYLRECNFDINKA